MVEAIQAGYKVWINDNSEMFKNMQKEKAQKAKLVLSKKVRYNGIVYNGWRELKEKTGLSKYKFIKYNMGTYT